MYSVITQRRVDNNYAVDLGFGINIGDSRDQGKGAGFFPCVKSDYMDFETSKNIQKKWRGGSESTDKITATSTEAAMKVAGSLSIEADIAKVAEISGEAHMDYQDTNKEKSLVRCFTSNVLTDEYQLDCSTLEPKHLMDPKNPPTHIVTNVVKGVSLTGSMALKDKTSDNRLKAGGSLQIKLASFPIGGKAKVDIDMAKFNQEYEFKAKLMSLNHGKPLEIGSLSQYCDTVSKWFQENSQENAGKKHSTVLYTLTPLQKFGTFSSFFPVVTPVTRKLKSDTNALMRNGLELVQYIEHLAKAPGLEPKAQIFLTEFKNHVQGKTKILAEFVYTKNPNYDKMLEVYQTAQFYTLPTMNAAIMLLERNPKFKGLSECVEDAKKLYCQKKPVRPPTPPPKIDPTPDLTPDPKPKPFEVKNPRHRFTIENNKARGKFLNLSGGSKDNGTKLHLWDNPQNADSQWHIKSIGGDKFNIVNVRSKKCVNVSGGGRNNGAKIQQWDNPQSRESQFKIHSVGGDAFTIQAVHSGKYINVSGGSTKNGTKIHQWDNPGSPDTQWLISLV